MRIAVIADVHGNVLALDAVLADLDRHGGADLVVDLGDRVSGPLWPAETFARFESLAPLGVRGNHDRAVASPGKLGRADAFARDALSPDQRATLGALPATMEVAPGILAMHARPHRDDAYLIERVRHGRQVRARPERIERRLRGLSARIVLTGHSHRPDLVRLRSGTLVLNPGSVGQPVARDDDHAIEAATPDARYALLDDDTVALLAVPYDHAAAAARAEANGRADWAVGLRTGWAR